MTEDDEQDSLIKTSVSLPPYLYDWVREIAAKEKQSKKKPRFNSQSSVMVVALSELKGKLDEQERVKAGYSNPEYDQAVTVVLTFLTQYPEFIPVINGIITQLQQAKGYTKKVTFE